MAFKLGTDFDVTKPADSSAVRRGAWWIRDLKSRIVSFCGVLFNLDTGDFRDNVIRSESLIDSGVTPGEYTSVTVDRKGRVTAGSNPVEQHQAKVYRAVFQAAAGANGFYDTDTGKSTSTGSTHAAYSSGSPAPFTGIVSASLNGSNFITYTFTIPDNVRRIKVIVVGAGGGGHAGHGGGGGEHREATLPVTPGSAISIAVGVGGAGGGSDQAGGPSLVNVGSLYVEAGAGSPGTAGSNGSAVAGASSGTVGTLVCSGGAGTTTAAGPSGSGVIGNSGVAYGTGGNSSGTNGADGVVILEWLI